MARKFDKLHYLDLLISEHFKHSVFQYITNTRGLLWINGININSLEEFGKIK